MAIALFFFPNREDAPEKRCGKYCDGGNGKNFGDLSAFAAGTDDGWPSHDVNAVTLSHKMNSRNKITGTVVFVDVERSACTSKRSNAARLR